MKSYALAMATICLLLAGCVNGHRVYTDQENEALTLDVSDPYRFYNPDDFMVAFPYDYSNYNAYLESYVKHFSWDGLPERLQWKWRACIVGYSMSNFTDREYWQLAAFARGEVKMSAGQLTRYHHLMAERAGPADTDLEKGIQAYCPDTVQALTPYIAQSKYRTVFKR